MIERMELLMDIYTTLLLDDENKKAMESAYHEDNNDSKRKKVMDNIFNAIQKFLNMIYGVIVKLINNFTSLFNRANKSVKSFSSRIIISDVHGYFKFINDGTDLLSESYMHIKKIRELDMNIVKEMSMMAAMKEKMKDMAIRSSSEMTTRQYYEDIHRHFSDYEKCKDALDGVIADANKDNVVTPIMRYSKDSLEKELNIPLKKIISQLKELRDDVKNAKETYAERKTMYKIMHKSDIDRTNKLFTAINYSLKQSGELEALYLKAMSYVEDTVNSADDI